MGVGLLRTFALDRRDVRAWVLYDWANSAFFTTIVTAVFPIFFIEVAQGTLGDRALASSYFAFATSGALALVALLGPILGVMADQRPLKKTFLAGFLFVALAATTGMAVVGSSDWLMLLVLFGVANVGASGSIVFYDSLLPHLVDEDQVDQVSAGGYALGYLGGGLLLVINLLMIMKPEWFGLSDGVQGTRLAFFSVAVWWFAFSLPLLRQVPEPPVRPLRDEEVGPLFRTTIAGLRETFRELRKYRQATLFLLAFLIYNDGISTVFRMATIFGAEIGLEATDLIVAVVLVQFVGIPCAFLFGGLAKLVGTRPAIMLGLAVYGAVSVFGYLLDSATEFYILAGLVGLVQGGTQALSRSLFASLIPKAESSRFFGLFAVFEKFAAIFGPAVFGAVAAVTGSSRGAILALIGFFLVGGLLLLFVKVDEGRAQARKSDALFDAATGRH